MSTVSSYHEKEFLRKYQEKVNTHIIVPFPQIISSLEKIKNKKVLDIGCGTGELDFEMWRKGAHVVGTDISKEWVALCTDKYAGKKGLSFERADAARLRFPKHSFDFVVMNLVLLNVDSKAKVRRIFLEISRVLKPGGVLLFSDLNPICIMTEDLPNRHQVYSKDFSYFKDGAYYTAQNFLENGETMEFKNRHWTLETYTRLLDETGMNIYRIVEPTYPRNAPIKLTHYKIPEYILLCCRKVKK